jgi:hypothetical protein
VEWRGREGRSGRRRREWRKKGREQRRRGTNEVLDTPPVELLVCRQLIEILLLNVAPVRLFLSLSASDELFRRVADANAGEVEESSPDVAAL